MAQKTEDGENEPDARDAAIAPPRDLHVVQDKMETRT